MKVVILAGGYGTRIRDVAENIPKPMIPIGEYPIIWHIMNGYYKFGYNDFMICLGFQGQKIKEYFLNYHNLSQNIQINLNNNKGIKYLDQPEIFDWNISLINTGLNTMTGGRISKLRNYLKDEDDFLLTYGDGLSNININKLIKFHKAHKKILTVTGVRPPGRFGEIQASEDGKIFEFNEKPQSVKGRISGGFFVVNKKIFDYLDENDDQLVFEDKPMKELVKKNELMMYKHDSFWQAMDTAREYKLLNDLYAAGNPPWNL